MAKRDTTRYTLREGNKIVYVGETNDLERRVRQHKASGKAFTSVRKEGPKVTKSSAKKWEDSRLDTYRKNHGGNNPKYNRDNDG